MTDDGKDKCRSKRGEGANNWSDVWQSKAEFLCGEFTEQDVDVEMSAVEEIWKANFGVEVLFNKRLRKFFESFRRGLKDLNINPPIDYVIQ